VLKQVRLHLAGGPAVDGGYRGSNVAKPGQQHAGQAERPLATVVDGEADKLLEGGLAEVAGCCWVLKQNPQLNQRHLTGR